jgi:hypothetical protein
MDRLTALTQSDIKLPDESSIPLTALEYAVDDLIALLDDALAISEDRRCG